MGSTPEFGAFTVAEAVFSVDVGRAVGLETDMSLSVVLLLMLFVLVLNNVVGADN